MSFHRFNPFTGRLKPATQSQALYPLAPSALQTEDPIMIYDSPKTKPAKISAPTSGQGTTLHPKMQRLFKQFQADLEKPSYLLAGTRDVILYRATAAMTAIVLAANLYQLYRLQRKFV